MILEADATSMSEILNRLELFMNNLKKSDVDLESIPGLKKQARANYRNRQNIPASSNLLLWSTNFGLDINWLLTGEGEMLRSAAVSHPTRQTSPAKDQHTSVEDMLLAPKPAQAIPLIGFAGCSTMGWHGSMTYPIAATAPHARPGMIAVMASGESMLPAGIGHGHICFCDPHAEPMPGECVYVVCHDNRHSLKTFLGWGEGEGHKINEGELVLRGWLDKHENEQQKDIVIHINRDVVKIVAPVVYVQRRL